MHSLYQDWQESESGLLRAAALIYNERAKPSRLSPLILMTDPSAHGDVLASARAMPKSSAIIYRHFGAGNRAEIAHNLRQETFARGQQLLIGNDPELAVECGADGVHFKRDAAVSAPTLWRARCPDWLITMAGIKGTEGEGGDYIDYSGDLSVLDGLMVSSVFASTSESAGKPIGLKKLLNITAVLGAPIVALGGVNDQTAEALEGYGLSGLAGRFEAGRF